MNSAPARVPRLYLITDRGQTGGRPLVEVVAAALAGIGGSGLPADEVAVQLRDKDLPGRPLAELGRALRTITAAAGVRLHINDRVDVALAIGADGVHLGGGALSPADVRALGPWLSIGVSTHTLTDVQAAATARADFVVFGPVHATPSKSAFGPPVGLAAMAELARLGGPPLLALGGIGPAEVQAVLRTGAHGVACIRAVMNVARPAEAVRAFCRALTDTPTI